MTIILLLSTLVVKIVVGAIFWIVVKIVVGIRFWIVDKIVVGDHFWTVVKIVVGINLGIVVKIVVGINLGIVVKIVVGFFGTIWISNFLIILSQIPNILIILLSVSLTKDAKDKSIQLLNCDGLR